MNVKQSVSSEKMVYIGLLFCVFCWGSNFIFGKILVAVFDAMTIAYLRLIFINIFLLMIGFKHLKSDSLNIKLLFQLLVAGFLGVTLNQWTFYASLKYADPITASLILAVAPIVTSLITFIYLKEKRPKVFWFSLCISFAGVWLVITGGSLLQFTFGLGELLITMTMLTFSVFLIMVQRLSAYVKPLTITLYTNLFGLLLFVPVIDLQSIQIALEVDFKYWLLLIITAILMHGVCTVIWNNSIQKVGATNASMLLNLEPFIVMVMGYFILKDSVAWIQIIGGVLIITGVFLSSNGQKLIRGNSRRRGR